MCVVDLGAGRRPARVRHVRHRPHTVERGPRARAAPPAHPEDQRRLALDDVLRHGVVVLVGRGRVRVVDGVVEAPVGARADAAVQSLL